MSSGLRGIEEGLALPDPIEGNAYDDPNARRRPLPVTLREASAAGRFRTGTLRVKIGWHYGSAEWRGHTSDCAGLVKT